MASCRYRPEGRRGLGFSVAHDDYVTGGPVDAKIRAGNERTLVIALIESERGIRNADAILAVPGIDVGWLGHYDLTDSMGFPAISSGPNSIAAVRRAARRLRQARQSRRVPGERSSDDARLACEGVPLSRLSAPMSGLFRDALSPGHLRPSRRSGDRGAAANTLRPFRGRLAAA